LVHAGNAGVGVVGIPIALWRDASRVFAPSGSAEKIALLDEVLGGQKVEDEYRDTSRHSLAEIVLAQTQKRVSMSLSTRWVPPPGRETSSVLL
jgi:NADPH:quinone reductase-like Zn-dependent oxidoreductase